MPGRLRIGAAIWTLFLLGACGVQGPPHPPRVEQPAAVKDLSLNQRGRTLELSFTLPQLTTDGERLTKPLEVEIFRALTAPGTLRPWMNLLGDELARYTKSGKVIFFYALSEQEFRQQHGSTFAFAIRTLTRGFRHRAVESEFSEAVQAILVDVPEPVQNLQVRAEEHALALSWSPPAQTASGRPVSGINAYRVYRSQTGKPGSFQLRGETDSPSYRDAEFEFGREYLYKVAAVLKEDGSIAESEYSQVVEITPRDQFPPAVPRELSAVYTSNAVELIWTANAEPDLAGYNIYRREEGGPAQKVNPELVRVPLLRDTSVAPGHRYFYVVTAVDLTGNESAPSEEIHVETR